MRLLTAILLLALALASLFVLWGAEAHSLAVTPACARVNPCALIDCNKRNVGAEIRRIA
jgi:hypothetical protein